MTWKIEASRRCGCWALCLLGVGLSACGTEGSSPEWPRFTDRAAASGLTEPVRAGDAQKADILEANTGGVAIIDYDQDGDRDLFFVNGGARSPYDEEVPRSMLYRNDGRPQFTNVSEESGADVTAWGMGVAVWDVDGDGWPDMFLSAWGANHLFLNQRDGTFGSVPSAGGASDDGWSTGIAAADYDLDGDVDVYVAQYVDRPAELEAIPSCTWRGIPAFCGPAGLPAAPDRLYERTWDGPSIFRDATEAAEISEQIPAYGLGAVAGDLDADGDPDLYVANDATPNFLYENRHHTADARWKDRLHEVGRAAGVAVSGDGRRQAGMGISVGDIDSDGHVDLLVSNFSHDHVSHYQQLDPLRFSETAFASDLGRWTLPTLGWGTGLADFDHDMDLDLFVSNGHVYPQVDEAGIGTTYRQDNQLFRNDHGFLRDVTVLSGSGLRVTAVSRGAALGDLDEDGDLDVVIVNLDSIPSLIRNEGVSAGWLSVELEGTRRNRMAIGARVVVSSQDGHSQVREIHAGTGYLSQDDHRLHFGAGTIDSVEIEVHWPGGRVESLGRMGVRQHVRINSGNDG